MGTRKERPSTGSGRTEPSGDQPPLRQSSGQALRIIPNKNRRLQVAPTRRRLFGRKAKAEFLEWFAATCNCSLSARKIGFHYRTVIRHWREDAEFGGQCEEALRMGYARLEELALREAEKALTRERRPLKPPAAPPAGRGLEGMDAAMALQLLREHKRLAGAAGGSGPGGKPGRRPRVATNAEVREALTKRLKAYRERVRARGGRMAEEEAPPPSFGRSPSPANAGEDLG